MLYLVLCLLTAVIAQTPSCRFALNYTTQDILANATQFEQDLLYWEGHFHQNNVSYNTANGMSYDGTTLDLTTGSANYSGLHHFSAASKEALQIMIYAHAVNGSQLAARFLSPQNESSAAQMAVDIMSLKLATYNEFNSTYPGYGSLLPWFLQNGSQPLNTTSDWVNRIPALDNGEALWAIYAFIEALQLTGMNDTLKTGWQSYLDYTATTAGTIFYKSSNASICAVTSIHDASLPVDSSNQTYSCETNGTLNDPYEGELFTFFLDLFGNLTDSEKEAVWAVKRPQLVAVNYTLDNSTGPITVRKGFWFSSHEEWNILELPYLDVPLVNSVFHNNQRARTCNSAALGIPGLYASVNNITDDTGAILGYISNAGIPSIANQTVQELDVITPYGAFPGKSVGLAWWHNEAQAKRMQNPYGSSESIRVDGTGMSSFVSWDSKITTVNALLGGVSALVRSKLQRDGYYESFYNRLEHEYSLVFGNITLAGQDVDLCLPNSTVPEAGLVDFTSCA